MWLCTSEKSRGDAAPYDDVGPYSTWLSAGTAVAQVMVAELDEVFETATFVTDGARLLTKTVDG